MLVSRHISLSSKHRYRQTANQLRRFRYGPSRRTQSVSYSSSSRESHRKADGKPMVSAEEQESRSWATYVIPAALLGFTGIAAFVHYNDERRAVPKGQGDHRPRSANATGPIIGGPFTLLDTENRIVNEKDLVGKWILLYFGYTFSPDVGPEQVQIMAKAVDKLESEYGVKVLPVFVSIDPQRDTPSHLRAYLKEFDPRLVGLTGPVGAVRQMAQEYRIYFRKVEDEGGDYLVESSHNMYLLNPKMEVVSCFGVEYTSEELAKTISSQVKAGSP